MLCPLVAGYSECINVNAEEHSVAGDSVMYGDVNNDGIINIVDMIMLKSYISEGSQSEFSEKAADLDNDGTVSSRDLVELSMYLMNQTGSFSCETNVDTDGDGLSDYIEKEILGTDINRVDTDEDGLDDYSEVYLCDTDPLKKDTGDTGTDDLFKDPDADGLTNSEEIRLGTSPTVADTDEDGINDYDEVKKYHTNPLKNDTDDDGISDLSELRLGLDPKKEKTDGKIKDKERKFEQSVDADSPVFEEINTDNEKYQLSLKCTAAGYIEDMISAEISHYSDYLQSETVSGDIVDISYDDEFELESIEISFSVSENASNYYIFKYSETTNMLMPIETKYDGNRIYTMDAVCGTYCLVDIFSWIDSSVDVEYADVSGVKQMSEVQPYEVYFMTYLNDPSNKKHEEILSASRSIIDYFNKISIPVRIHFISSLGLHVKNPSTGLYYVDNKSSDEDIATMINSAGKYYESSKNTHIIENILNTKVIQMFKENSEPSKVFYLIDYEYQATYEDNSTTSLSLNKRFHNYNVDYIKVYYSANNNNREFYKLLSDVMQAEVIGDDFAKKLSDSVKSQYKFNDEVIGWNYYTGALGSIKLDSEITIDWFKAARGDYTAEQIKEMGFSDSDNDGIYDFQEINWSFVTIDGDKILLPTLEFLYKSNFASNTGLINLIKRYKELGIDIDISTIRVLPLVSDPLKDDSDKDGIPDKDDKNAVFNDLVKIDDSIIDDSKIFDDGKNYKKYKVSGGGTADTVSGDRPNTVIRYTRSFNELSKSSEKVKSVSEFSLKPSRNSDYKITVDTDKDDMCRIEVLYNKGKKVQKAYSEREYGEYSIAHHEKCYVLTGLREYTIRVIVTSKNGINNSYTVNVEQDNWVYAPYGGVSSFPEAPLLNYRSVYLIDEAVRNISSARGIMKYEDWESNKQGDSRSTFIDYVKDDLAYVCYEAETPYYLYMIIPESGELSMMFEISSNISTIATYSGVIAMFIGDLDKVGNAATLIGGATTFIASFPVSKSTFETSIKRTLNNMNLDSVDIRITGYTLPKGERIESSEWRSKYINKYTDVSGTINRLKIELF